MAAYAIAGAAIVLLAFGSAFVVSFAKEGTVARLGAGAPTVKRWGGIVLLILGAWFIALGVFAKPFAHLFPVSPPS